LTAVPSGPYTARKKCSNMSEVTQILSQMESGDPAAAELLLPLVYHELRPSWRRWRKTIRASAPRTGRSLWH
jgi:hypothetical protein